MHQLIRPISFLFVVTPFISCSGETTHEDTSTAEGSILDTDSETLDTGLSTVDADGDGHSSDVDCDDDNATVHPEAEEICDELDNDCDDEIDEGVSITFYVDSDSDGYGFAEQSIQLCEEESGYVLDSSDCDDNDETVFPGSHAIETPGDGIDQDCDGVDACSDLNCDGWPDIVVNQSDNSSGISESEVRLFWGTEEGYSQDVSSALPTQFSSHSTTADLNSDGYLDIVFTEDSFYGDGVSQASAWVYWGSAEGFLDSNVDSFPVEMSWGTAAFDMNGDAYLDLAVSSYNESMEPGLWIYAGSSEGYLAENGQYLPAISMVSQITPADLNGDSHVDLTIAGWGEAGSSIYWGSDAGFEPDNRTDIPTGGHAWDVLIEDFNGDAYPDLLFTHQYGSEGMGDFDGSSVVYWGTFSGPDLTENTKLATYAAAGACAGDLNADGFPDAVVAEIEWLSASKTGDQVTIFWGSSVGLTDTETTVVSATGPTSCSIHDLNLDGHMDLVIGNLSSGDDAAPESQIHWGSDGGLQVDTWSPLSTGGVYSVSTHPMEDGY